MVLAVFGKLVALGSNPNKQNIKVLSKHCKSWREISVNSRSEGILIIAPGDTTVQQQGSPRTSLQSLSIYTYHSRAPFAKYRMAIRPLEVLLLVFPGFNTLDLNGPVEVLGSSSLADKHPFNITIAAASEVTEAFEHVLIKRHISFPELLDNSASGIAISSYDIMVLPGGPATNVHQVVDSGGDGFLEVIKAFTSQERTSSHQKWLVSIVSKTIPTFETIADPFDHYSSAQGPASSVRLVFLLGTPLRRTGLISTDCGMSASKSRRKEGYRQPL
jgi:hypothetical protein